MPSTLLNEYPRQGIISSIGFDCPATLRELNFSLNDAQILD